MGLELLLYSKYVGYHGQYETHPNFYKPLCCATNKLEFLLESHFVMSCLLFKGVKSLYFTYLIVNFTTLNLQGIMSLHLLTTRVGLLTLLKSTRLYLQITGVA